MTILHVIPGTGIGLPPPRCHSLALVIACSSGAGGEALLIGTAEDQHDLVREGLHPWGLIVPPGGMLRRTVRTVRRILADRERQGWSCDLLVGWSLAVGGLLASAFPGRPAMIVLEQDPPRGLAAERDIAAIRMAGMHLVVTSQSAARAWSRRGLAGERMTCIPEAVRVHDHTAPLEGAFLVACFIVDPARELALCEILAHRLRRTGRPFRVVACLPPGIRPGLVPCMMMRQWPTVAASGSGAAVIGALVPGPQHEADAGTVAWIRGHGVPLLAGSSPVTREIIEDGHTGFLTDPGHVESLCDRLLRMEHDRERTSAMAANGCRVESNIRSPERISGAWEEAISLWREARRPLAGMPDFCIATAP